jgi:hypothetical protein
VNATPTVPLAVLALVITGGAVVVKLGGGSVVGAMAGLPAASVDVTR